MSRRLTATMLGILSAIAGPAVPALLALALAVATAQPLHAAGGGALGMEFVEIPGGEFQMRGEDGDAFDDEKPPHRVRIATFRIGKSEVTQRQWRTVMGDNPSQFSGCDDCPVERVSWDDVQEFIRRARAQTGLALRLPTEAEWEYAARGGSAQQKWAGTSSEGELGEYAWYDANAGGMTHPVCQKRPNRFGLCDMSGNVHEWVSDWYGEKSYGQSPGDNPAGPSSGLLRVFRSGGWGLEARRVRAANRYWLVPARSRLDLGFRLVVPPGQP